MKIKIFALFVAILMIFSMSVSAEETFSVSVMFNAMTEDVVISGEGNGEIIITVMKFADSEDSLSLSNLPVDMFQFTSKGAYTHTIYMPDNAKGGKYKVIASANGYRAEDSFIYINSEEAEDALDKVNAKTNKAEFIDEVIINAEKLGIDVTDEFYDDNKNEIIGLIFDMGKKADASSEFYNEYYKAHALSLIKSLDASDKDFETEAESILSTYALYLEIDYSEEYENDKRLSKDAKKELLKLLAAENFNTALKKAKPFGEYFEQTKALAAIKGANIWQDIKNVILTDFAEIFEDMVKTDSYYKKVKTVQNVYSKMIKDTFTDFEDIETSFASASKSVYKKENSDNSGGSSSGTTGGSYGGGSVTTVPQNPDNPLWTPTVEEVEEVEEEVSEMRELPTFNDKAVISFTDLDRAHWSYKAVSAMSSAGVIKGYEDNTFRPDGQITRAEFTKMIYEAFGIGDGVATFSDVSKDAWYYKYISGAAKNNIIKGNDGVFRPNDKITRQDAALIIYRAIHYRDVVISGNATFEDNAEIARYAYPAVGALKSYSVVKGIGGNVFRPKSNVTRAEAAQMIYQAVNVVLSAQK